MSRTARRSWRASRRPAAAWAGGGAETRVGSARVDGDPLWDYGIEGGVGIILMGLYGFVLGNRLRR